MGVASYNNGCPPDQGLGTGGKCSRISPLEFVALSRPRRGLAQSSCSWRSHVHADHDSYHPAVIDVVPTSSARAALLHGQPGQRRAPVAEEDGKLLPLIARNPGAIRPTPTFNLGISTDRSNFAVRGRDPVGKSAPSQHAPGQNRRRARLDPFERPGSGWLARSRNELANWLHVGQRVGAERFRSYDGGMWDGRPVGLAGLSRTIRKAVWHGDPALADCSSRGPIGSGRKSS